MPYVADRRKMYKRKRNYGKKFQNRTYINRIADAAPRNQMSRYLSDFNPFPAIHYASLRYVQQIQINPPTPAKAGTHYFRANSIHDPDYTGATLGGQPYGHDTYQNLYNHYQVLHSTIIVQGNPSSNQPEPGFGVLLQDNNNIVEDEARQLCAMKGASYCMQGVGQTNSIKRSFDTKYMQDKSTQIAGFGSDVADPMYFVVFSMDDTATNKSLFCTVTIVYQVKMWELRDLSST